MTVHYRKAELADVTVLRDMVQALSDHDGGTGPVGPEAALIRHGFGDRPLFQAVIAEQDDLPLGMVIYYGDFSTHRGEAGVYVLDIYVAPTGRGLGVGRGLLSEMMRQQDWGAKYITLGVTPDNAIALGFYDKVGFRGRGYEFMILDGPELEALL